MTNLWREFKEYALQGSMIDLALGLVIGSTGASVITSLVKGILVPRVRMLAAGTNPTNLPPVDYDSVWGSIVSFLITAFIVFLIVKAVNRMRKGKDTEPVEKLCPHCFFDIPIQATRCGHCTSQLPSEQASVATT